MKTSARSLFAQVATTLFVFVSLLPTASASDYRDAPTIGSYSSIDLSDLYVFRDPADSSKLVVAMTTQASQNPMLGPTYHFQENALYRINFTTRRDARPTATIDINFGPFGNGSRCPSPGPPCQVFRAVFPNNAVIEGLTTQGTYGATHLAPMITSAVGIDMFVGPREDPFFFDLVGFNRSVATGLNKFTGVDAFLGTNVNAIVVRFPVDMVFPPGNCIATTTSGFSTPCGTWATTYLRHDESKNFENVPHDLNQMDRIGNPLVSAALIPQALKDAFNLAEPKDDPRDFTAVMTAQILSLDKRFGTCPPSATSAAACNPNVPFLMSIMSPDTLRFASNTADGFPNGRRLADRTTDVVISLTLQIPGFTDGTATKTYCSAFPFLGPPLQLSGTAPFKVLPQACP